MTSLLRFNSKLVTHLYELSAWSQPPYRVRIVASIAIPFRTHFEAYLTAPVILRLVLFRATVCALYNTPPRSLLSKYGCIFRVTLYSNIFSG